jgi:hydrogenase maturation protease
MSDAGAVPVLIVGVGNAYRRDDGAGLAAAARLAEAAGAPVALHDGLGDGTALLETWRGAETVILLDATRSGAPAGTVHRLDGAPEAVARRAADPHASTHALGLADAIALGAVLRRLPRRLVIIGIEGSCFEHGVGLSPAVGRAVTAAVDAGLQEVARARSGSAPQGDGDVSRAAR